MESNAESGQRAQKIWSSREGTYKHDACAAGVHQCGVVGLVSRKRDDDQRLAGHEALHERIQPCGGEREGVGRVSCAPRILTTALIRAWPRH